MSLEVRIRKKLSAFTLDVSFEEGDGIACLLGASGCGKSMTLKCIAGIERPDSGRIALDGRILYDSEKGICLPPQERRVGYLFQNYALFPNMTVRQNILCGLHREKDRAAKEARVRELIGMLRLTGLEDRRPSALSGGEQQRTALARILANDPEMILLDEPFSALDSYLRDSLKTELKELLLSYGKKTLLVTHSRDEAYNMGREIAVMDEGRILAIKPAKRLFADPGSIAAARVTGCKNISPAERVSEHEVRVPAWGVTLKTASPVGDGLRAVGIRAHYFNPGAGENRFGVIPAGEMEEPFETILLFRIKGQAAGAPPLWWRLPKDKKPQAFPAELGINPVNVLLLYE